MSGYLNRFKGNRLVKHVMVLAGGTAFAQLITVLLLPVLTRLYTPEDFNVFAVYVALVSVMSVAASLRLDIAIPIPEDDVSAANVFAVALVAAVIISALIAVPAFLFSAEVSALLNQPFLQPYLWVVPLGVFSASVYSVFQYWATRRKNFGLIARTKILQAASAGSVQIGLGMAAHSPAGLIFGNLTNSVIGALGIARKHWSQDKAAFSKVSTSRMRLVLKRYDQFPKYSTFEALANNAAIQLPVIVIAGYALGPEAGYLMLAMQIMQAPMALIGSAVAQVYLSVAPSAYRERSLGELTASMLGGLMKAGVGPLLFAGIVAPAAFGLVFGDGWGRAGVLVAWMTPWFIVQLLASPVSMALHVMDRQRSALALQLVGLGIRLGAVLVGTTWLLDYISELYAISGFIFYGLYLAVVLGVVSAPITVILSQLKSSVVWILLWGAMGIVVRIALSYWP